jgi:hypothetical protein
MTTPLPLRALPTQLTAQSIAREAAGRRRAGGCPMPRTSIEPDPLGCRKIREQKG